MKAETAVIVQRLRKFAPTGEDDWNQLEETIEQLWQTGEPEKGMVAMFRILEDYTDEEGGTTLWSILHSLESLPVYEKYLLDSVNRKPSDFNLRMLNRILNANQTTVYDQPIRSVIKGLLSDKKLTERLIADNQKLISRI